VVKLSTLYFTSTWTGHNLSCVDLNVGYTLLVANHLFIQLSEATMKTNTCAPSSINIPVVAFNKSTLEGVYVHYMCITIIYEFTIPQTWQQLTFTKCTETNIHFLLKLWKFGPNGPIDSLYSTRTISGGAPLWYQYNRLHKTGLVLKIVLSLPWLKVVFRLESTMYDHTIQCQLLESISVCESIEFIAYF